MTGCLVIIILLLLIYYSTHLVENVLNRAATHVATKIGISAPRIQLDILGFTVIIRNLKLDSEAVLHTINSTLHHNCQFEQLEVSEVKITLLPRIHVSLDKVIFVGYSKHPNNWSVDSVMDALRSSRLQILDTLTTAIAYRLKHFRRGDILGRITRVPLYLVDALIGTAELDIFGASVGFCSRRMFQSDDILMVVSIAHLRVRPASTFKELCFTPMIKVRALLPHL